MEHIILAAQAQALKWVGLIWLGIGVMLGNDLLQTTWQASLAAFLSMMLTGLLLRICGHSIVKAMAGQLAAQEAEDAEQRAEQIHEMQSQPARQTVPS